MTVETEEYVLRDSEAVVHLSVPVGWKPSVDDDHSHHWIIESPDDEPYSLHFAIDPLFASGLDAAGRRADMKKRLAATKEISGEQSGEYVGSISDGVARYRMSSMDGDPGDEMRYVTVGRLLDRGQAGVRSFRLVLVCYGDAATGPKTDQLIAYCEAEADRLAGCIEGSACREVEDVVFRFVTAASDDSTWTGRIPLDWDFYQLRDKGWEACSPDGEHVVSVWSGPVLAPGSAEAAPETKRLIKLVSHCTQRLHALDLDGDAELSRRQDDETWNVHGRFFDGEGTDRKLVRRWYGLVPADDVIASVQINYAVPARRGYDPDVEAFAAFFAKQTRNLKPATEPKSPSV